MTVTGIWPVASTRLNGWSYLWKKSCTHILLAFYTNASCLFHISVRCLCCRDTPLGLAFAQFRGVGTGPADPAAAGPIIWQAIIFMFTLYQFSRTWVDSREFMPSDVRFLMLKCTKFDSRWGSASDPLAGFKAPTSKGREAKIEGTGRMESGGKKWGPYYYERGKKEVDRWEGRGGKGRGRDLLDQCQTASYAPAVYSDWALCCAEFLKFVSM